MTQSPRFVPLLVIAFALAVGLAIAFTSKLVARVEASSPDPGDAIPVLTAVIERLDRIEQRLAQIEQQEITAAAPAAPANGTRAPLPDDALVDLARRIERLERSAPRRDGGAHEDPALPALGQAEPAQRALTAANPAERIETHRQTILDATKTEQEKVEALRALRGLGREAWSEAVVQEMARIGLASTDASIRADVWRQLHSADQHRSMVPSLLLALANDPDAKVREEAAETLGSFDDDPIVMPALQSAAANDASERVRRQAANSLRSERRRR